MPALSTIQPTITLPYEELHFVNTTLPVWNYSLLTDEAIKDFQLGINYTLYYTFGSHLITVLNTTGFYFAVWAPNAASLSVIGSFNQWNATTHQLILRQDGSGIWEGYIPHIPLGTLYKYHIVSTTGMVVD